MTSLILWFFSMPLIAWLLDPFPEPGSFPVSGTILLLILLTNICWEKETSPAVGLSIYTRPATESGSSPLNFPLSHVQSCKWIHISLWSQKLFSLEGRSLDNPASIIMSSKRICTTHKSRMFCSNLTSVYSRCIWNKVLWWTQYRNASVWMLHL